ncbi:MAG: cbb3-type cytochrome oxidase assembly protein CcoS, partial [Desulfobacterales bacterium]|jgi:cbb3-type cytochrome oxidase maturation protein
MYYPYFIAYMAAGFIISLVVFFWALNSGQFKDQQRARFLPLQNDLQPRPANMPRFARLQTVALFTLLCLCLVSASAVVIFSLIKGLK